MALTGFDQSLAGTAELHGEGLIFGLRKMRALAMEGGRPLKEQGLAMG